LHCDFYPETGGGYEEKGKVEAVKEGTKASKAYHLKWILKKKKRNRMYLT
jgi:hypothetical protein